MIPTPWKRRVACLETPVKKAWRPYTKIRIVHSRSKDRCDASVLFTESYLQTPIENFLHLLTALQYYLAIPSCWGSKTRAII